MCQSLKGNMKGALKLWEMYFFGVLQCYTFTKSSFLIAADGCELLG